MVVGIFGESQELKDLLKAKPCELPSFEGLQDKDGDYDRSYGAEMKRFKSIFGWATNEILKPVAVWTDDNIERGRGYAQLVTGFQASVVSGRFDDVEATAEASKLARMRERGACKMLMDAFRDPTFIAGIRKAHNAAKGALLARKFDASDGKLKNSMMRSVHLPEEKGAGLPNLLRVVVAHGALAVAVWWAIVEGTEIGSQFDAVLAAAGKLIEERTNNGGFRQ